MRALENIDKAKARLEEVRNSLSQGDFIEDILRGLDPALVTKCKNNYTEVLDRLKFEEEQLKAEIEANRSSLRTYMLRNNVHNLSGDLTKAKIVKRSSYDGSRSEQILRDNGLLQQAIAAGAIEYSGPTVRSTKLSSEMRTALEDVVNYRYSMTLK